MSATATVLEIFVVYVSAAVTPGPNVLIIIRTAAESRRAALAVAGGVVVAGGVLACIATFGIPAVLAHVRWLERAMRIVCGAYLAHIGLQLIIRAADPLDAVDTAGRGTLATSFRRGLLTNLSNPKAALFFGAVLTGMLPSPAPAWLQVTVVAVIVASSAAWHTLVALVFSTGAVQSAYGRAKPTLNRMIGTVLAAFGVTIVID
jgi:threonine efflux protein